MKQNIHRRRFILDTSAALALAAFNPNSLNLFSQATPRRVALIGTGWYGKSDLFRLMQVAPVDVVAINTHYSFYQYVTCLDPRKIFFCHHFTSSPLLKVRHKRFDFEFRCQRPQACAISCASVESFFAPS